MPFDSTFQLSSEGLLEPDFKIDWLTLVILVKVWSVEAFNASFSSSISSSISSCLVFNRKLLLHHERVLNMLVDTFSQGEEAERQHARIFQLLQQAD